MIVSDWSPDGQLLLYCTFDAPRPSAIWTLPLTGERKPRLFLQGLTLLDLGERRLGVALSMSHVAARQEVRDLRAQVGKPPGGAGPDRS